MSEAPSDPISYRPDLPDWGVYLRWPTEGNVWIHPDDVELAERLIPSRRVFKRFRWDGEFYWLAYGKLRLRVAPTMWLAVPGADIEVGNQVELLARHGENDAGIYRVRELLFASKRGELEFFLERGEMPLPNTFGREDIRPLQQQFNLRVGYYEHARPKSQIAEGQPSLNVGNIMSSEPSLPVPNSRHAENSPPPDEEPS